MELNSLAMDQTFSFEQGMNGITLAAFLQRAFPDKNYEDIRGYDLQINYEEVRHKEMDAIYLEEGDIIRLAKPFEDPIQFIYHKEESN